MRRSQRIRQNLVYKTYHLTGDKVFKDKNVTDLPGSESGQSEMSGDQAKALEVKILGLTEDIFDFIDEYGVDDIKYNVSDMDAAIQRMEDFRSIYREKHHEALSVLGDDECQKLAEKLRDGNGAPTTPEAVVSTMKKYIVKVKGLRKEARCNESAVRLGKIKVDNEYFNFLKTELEEQIKGMKTEVDKDPSTFEDNDLVLKKAQAADLQKKLEVIWNKILEMMKMGIDSKAVETIKTSYSKLVESKEKYVVSLQSEVLQREIKKKENFKKSKLSIKLPKFSGYDSSTDVYTFQTDFEKIHLADTPTDIIPDLLKNNYLTDPALSLVKSVEDIDEIWKRLKQAYGNPKILLQKKLRELNNFDTATNRKDYTKAELWISKIIMVMKDLSKLATDHKIESLLYNGDGLDRIMKIIGEGRVTRWLAKECDEADLSSSEDSEVDFEAESKKSWQSLVKFLEMELKVLQKKSLVFSNPSEKEKPQIKNPREEKQDGGNALLAGDLGHFSGGGSSSVSTSITCVICSSTDHETTMGPRKSKLVQYFACDVFVNMSVADRFKFLREKNLCFQCLYPGADWNSGKHKEGKCQKEYVCKHSSHDKFTRKKHVLVCDDHKTDQENQDTFKAYKERCIQKNQNLPSFSRDLSLVCSSLSVVGSTTSPDATKLEAVPEDEEDEPAESVFIFQFIEIKNEETGVYEQFLLFYDSGCGKFLVRYRAVQKLGSKRATLRTPPPLYIRGIGGIVVESPYGSYKVQLPLAEGGEATLSGTCLEQVTEEFPMYPLQGAVEEDVRTAYKISGGDVNDLPRVPKFVGGEVDFLFGMKYNRHNPREVFRTISGLSIYESKFKNPDGSRGLIGGNHEVFTAIEQQFYSQQYTEGDVSTFLRNQLHLYTSGYSVTCDAGRLGYQPKIEEVVSDEEIVDQVNAAYKGKKHPPKELKKIDEIENAGTEISYRCPACRQCKCDDGCPDQHEAKSIREEVEEHLIKNAITIDHELQKCVAKLPVMEDPEIALAPNKHKALSVYKRQVKKLDNSPADKASILKAEKKLQDLGFVQWVKNLSVEDQEMLKNSKIQNYIPWLIAWKLNSVSSPCRPVFNASQPTDTGKSFNDILAKGRNSMNKLQEVFMRWTMHKVAFHCDLQTWYNSVDLRKEDWCYQRYLWEETLNPNNPPESKVVTSIIYGVKPSGNLVQRAMLDAAALSKDEFPEAFEVISRDLYADDCMSGEQSLSLAEARADEMEMCLNPFGFTSKGYAFSGKDPPENLSDDGECIYVAGMKWYPKTDQLAFTFGDVNFARKSRGRKPPVDQPMWLPEILTRRHVVAFVAEMFDLAGRINPFISAMKIDLNDLSNAGLGWDDAIPDNLRGIWKDHVEMREEIRNFRYNRAIIPEDAASLDITTIDFGDASQRMACVAIYVRFQRKNGQYSCQLVLARSRVVNDKTQPRAELFAAVLSTHSGEIVRKAFYKHHKGHLKMCDSQIVLYWLSNSEKPLKLWPRNRVIECRRLTNLDDWRYLPTDHMMADLGTRRGVTAADIHPESEWINGREWMKGDQDSFPCKKIDEMLLSAEELKIARSEVPFCSDGEVGNAFVEDLCSLTRYVEDQTSDVYAFSQYVIDPNLRKFSTVIRILSWCYRFLRLCKSRSKPSKDSVEQILKTIQPVDSDVDSAKAYFFKKATQEVKHFHKGKLVNFTEKDGVLLYTGRLLPDGVQIITPMADAMKDLASTTFCVPAVYKHSPISYAIVNDVHWNDPVVKHGGNESVLRYVLKTAFIIEGRDIVKRTRKSCERCRYLAKRTIEIAMGPLSHHNLIIAPAFYACQCDLAGPFKCSSPSNKRATVKIWMAVFVCATTGTTVIKVMEDYSSHSFISAFIRLSCDVGYPKTLLIDSGSQITSSCENMEIDFQDVKSKLYRSVQVECEVVPVGGHNMNGKVERKIREIKSSIEKTVSNQRMSVLQWETLGAKIANRVNDLPLAVGNVTSDFENLDLITPNRLRLGRNNDRSPVGDLSVTNDAAKLLEENQKIFQCWFENWLVSCVPNLVDQPKWYKTEHHIQVGDIVLFTKDDTFSPVYRFGIVCSTSPSKDGIVRKVTVRYRNSTEKVDRTTERAVRSLVVIHKVDEINIMQDLYEMERKAMYYAGGF